MISARLWMPAQSERAALFGFFQGGAMSMLFAATYPQRVVPDCLRYAIRASAAVTKLAKRPDRFDRARAGVAAEIFGQSARSKVSDETYRRSSPAGARGGKSGTMTQLTR